MSQIKKNFIPRNEGFKCEACEKDVLPAQGTFRNHCPFCLTGKHVDLEVPGDRQSACGGLMPTVEVQGTDPDKLVLVQRCSRCLHEKRNKAAADDDRDKLFGLNT